MTRGFLIACTALVTLGAACSSSHTGASTTTRSPGVNLLPPQQSVPPVESGPGPYLRNAAGYPDHWHAALGVNICGKWQPGPIWPTYGNGTLTRHDAPDVYAGLHTHQLVDGSSDGLIHMEPYSPDEAGANATLGKYMEFGGWSVSATAMHLWPPVDGASIQYQQNGAPVIKGTPISVQNGQLCGSRPGVVRWATGQFVPGQPTTLVEQHGDPARLHLEDNQVIGLYFVPASTALASLGAVPSTKNLPSAQGVPTP